jgi:hypothetical protein
MRYEKERRTRLENLIKPILFFFFCLGSYLVIAHGEVRHFASSFSFLGNTPVCFLSGNSTTLQLCTNEQQSQAEREPSDVFWHAYVLSAIMLVDVCFKVAGPCFLMACFLHTPCGHWAFKC